jgi:hypothetical protein
MARKTDFKTLVIERSQRIVRDAAQRTAYGKPADAEQTKAPETLVRRLMARIPEPIRESLRDALGPDPKIADGHSLLARGRRQMDDVKSREAVVEAARRVLAKREVTADEVELELRAKAVQLHVKLAEAASAAKNASNELRVPVGSILYSASDAPRPIRGVERLAINIKRFGQLTPIVVRPAPGNRYTLITGYRRMEALKSARCTHALIRVVKNLDEATAAALYAVENCMVDGVSSNAIKHLAARIDENHPLANVLHIIQADDEETVEDVYLEDMAEEANHSLAEGAAWVAALRPYWADLDDADRMPLEALIVYFSKVAKRFK